MLNVTVFHMQSSFKQDVIFKRKSSGSSEGTVMAKGGQIDWIDVVSGVLVAAVFTHVQTHTVA